MPYIEPKPFKGALGLALKGCRGSRVSTAPERYFHAGEPETALARVPEAELRDKEAGSPSETPPKEPNYH